MTARHAAPLVLLPLALAAGAFLSARPEAERRPAGVAAALEPGAAPAEVATAREETLAEVNEARRRKGLPALAPNAALERAAAGHAADMIARDFFAHESPDGTTPHARASAAGYGEARVIGETIAYGQPTAREVVAAWIKSRGHRRILLEKEVTECGVGIAIDEEGRGKRIVWVALFAAPGR